MQETLLRWHAKTARELPWRRRRDPYAVLVSEVMLQQTQVSRVVPRFEAWLARWPDLAALAAASPADVIREWQGLGYNRRALALHLTARLVTESGWPEDLISLPGVGPYTAAAIRRFAFGDPVLPADVNVRRVLERTGGSFGPEAAEALMDLGATVCIARVPRCGACPLAAGCPARGRRYAAERRQGPFEGSFRQRRARTLRSLAAGPRPAANLDAAALSALVADGLAVVAAGEAQLPGSD
jgi:A/G-specific adenine glycosylase